MPFDIEFIDYPAVEYTRQVVKESFKVNVCSGAPENPELAGYPPLLLAVAGPAPSLYIVKTLTQKKFRTREEISGNNILHICAEKCVSDEVFIWCFSNYTKGEILLKNNEGLTPLDVCRMDP